MPETTTGPEFERVLAGHLDCSCPDLLDRYRVAHLSAVLHAEVERILAAHEAAWAEKYAAVVVGERDGLERLSADQTTKYVAAAARSATERARAESAEAALATALREKAEDRARVEAVAESIAYEHAATIDGEFGCCHDEDALRAGGRVTEFDGDEFEPIPDDCPGKKTLDRHLDALRSALAIPTATGDE